jgi:hypothetical protein
MLPPSVPIPNSVIETTTPNLMKYVTAVKSDAWKRLRVHANIHTARVTKNQEEENNQKTAQKPKKTKKKKTTKFEKSPRRIINHPSQGLHKNN